MALLIYLYMVELHLAFREDMTMHLLQVQVTGVNVLLIPKRIKHLQMAKHVLQISQYGKIPQYEQLY